MTLSELSLRNARRQTRDYLVYFVTVVMAAALLYAFNGLVFSQELLALSQLMSSLPMIITAASVVVVCVFGWLVSYATGFMLSRRSRELGTYLLIGLDNGQVARLFFLENLAVGGCALALGLVFGNLLFQALRAVVLTLFGLPYHFSFAFSLQASALTTASFVLIYLYALWKSRRRIRKMKIYDLIYLDKLNEGMVIQTSQKRKGIFIISIVLGIVGTFFLIAGKLLPGFIGAGCLIIFLYGFFLSFASGVPAFFDKYPIRKYRGQNLLVFRTLTAKLATMGMLMATISMIFTASLITEGSGLVFHNLFTGRAAENACFDLYIGSDGAKEFSREYLDYIGRHIPVEQSLLYSVYHGETLQTTDCLKTHMDYQIYGYSQDPVMAYSDYVALRAIAGYPTVELQQGQYLIHCKTYLEDTLRDYASPIAIGETRLTPANIYTEQLTQRYGTGNGHEFILIVPDETIKTLPVHHRAYAARTKRPVSEKQYLELYDICNNIYESSKTYDTIHTKADEEATVASMTAMTVFPLYFLALALTMTAATILTIQQLSESERYGRQFALLQKLGMDRKDMTKALRTQFAIYYAMPAVPPVLISIPFILTLSNAPEPGVMVGSGSPAAIAGIAVGLFFLIYAVYILLAYTNLKRNVLPEEFC